MKFISFEHESHSEEESLDQSEATVENNDESETWCTKNSSSMCDFQKIFIKPVLKSEDKIVVNVETPSNISATLAQK